MWACDGNGGAKGGRTDHVRNRLSEHESEITQIKDEKKQVPLRADSLMGERPSIADITMLWKNFAPIWEVLTNEEL